MTDDADGHDPDTMSDKRTLSYRVREEVDCNQLQNSEASFNPTVAEYLRAAHSDNTRRAYVSDLKHFRNWGGRIPSSPDGIARYLAAHAKSLNSRTLRRRLAALAQAHTGQVEDPTKSVLIARLMRGIVRCHEVPPRQATPLMLSDLERISAVMRDDARAARDRALLLLGFFAALRRSEIVALEWQDVQQQQDGLLISICRSKTDQSAKGRQVFVLARTDTLCPAKALRNWADVAGGIGVGPVFFTSCGRRISDRAVARTIQRWCLRAGLRGRFSGHSLRAGYATTEALLGTDATLIARQTGHRSLQTLAAYVRPFPVGGG